MVNNSNITRYVQLVQKLHDKYTMYVAYFSQEKFRKTTKFPLGVMSDAPQRAALLYLSLEDLKFLQSHLNDSEFQSQLSIKLQSFMKNLSTLLNNTVDDLSSPPKHYDER